MSDPTQVKPALAVFAELRRGRVANELSEHLHELLTACNETGKKGTLTFKLTVSPQKTQDYETPRVEITDVITVSKPRPNSLPSAFYLDGDSNLTRRDPNQDTFEGLQDVSATETGTPTTSVREAN